jgi:DNA modification methylase
MPDFKDQLNHYYIENCIDTMNNRIPDESINLVLTSPPYDNIRKYNNNNCFDFETIAKLLTQKLVKGGVIVWVVGDQTIKGSETGTSFKQALYFKNECGLRLHDTMLFMKNSTSFPARRLGKRYSQIFEYMFVFSKGTPAVANLICDKPNKWAGYTNFGQRSDRDKDDNLILKKKFKPIPDFSPRTNVWTYVTGKGYSKTDNIAYKHPAIFPEPLAIDHIITWTNPGQIVYDCFLGSGTVAKISQKLGRFWMGSEINPKYEYIIKQRLENI